MIQTPASWRTGVLCLAFLSFCAPAAADPCAALNVRNPAGNYFIGGTKGNIPYSGDLALDAYVQRGSPRPLSVIVIHGGRWSSGSRIAHVGQILETLTRSGFNWFSLDYRLGGLARYEESLADIRNAIGFIRCHASELHVDANRLVLLGEDSGAHLAALLATKKDLPAAGIIGAVLVGGFYDLATTPSLTRDIDRDVLLRATPAAPLTAVPMLVVHGGEDDEVPADQARRYCARIVDARGRCQFVEVAGASHRSENWWPNQWDYKTTIVQWLSNLGGKASPYQPLAGPVQKDIVYRASPKLALDAFIPQASAPVPAVIVAHGGGWEAGDKVTYITPILEPLARAGLAWFSIDYRLTPSAAHEEQLDDLREAIRFVRDGHARFNIDPTRVFLLGESASGQMVSLLATEDRSLAGVVSFYGVYDFHAMVTDASPRSHLVRLFRRNVLDEESREVLRKYSPSYRAHKDMPPMLLINGTGERLWAQAQSFDRRLSELGVSHEVVTLDGAPHGMENWEGHLEWMFYKSRVVEWIRQVAARH